MMTSGNNQGMAVLSWNEKLWYIRAMYRIYVKFLLNWKWIFIYIYIIIWLYVFHIFSLEVWNLSDRILDVENICIHGMFPKPSGWSFVRSKEVPIKCPFHGGFLTLNSTSAQIFDFYLQLLMKWKSQQSCSYTISIDSYWFNGAEWNKSEMIYRKVSDIRCTLVGNKIVDHSDVVGASPVSAAPTTSSFST